MPRSFVAGQALGSAHLDAHNTTGYTDEAHTWTGVQQFDDKVVIKKGHHGYNVRAFGAVGDGTTDDTSAIQGAIDQAVSDGATTANNARVIYFPGGVYGISSRLLVPTNITFVGDGPKMSRLKALTTFTFPGRDTAMVVTCQTSAGGQIYYDVPGPSSRFSLRNMGLDGNNRSGANGILCSLQQPSYWENVLIENCPGYGIAIVDTQQIPVWNLEIINCGDGLVLNSAAFVWVYAFNVEQGDTTYVKMTQQGKSNATCSTTNGSTTVTIGTPGSDPAGYFVSASDVGQSITGTGIPGGTTIASVQSSTQATLSQAATATGSGVTLTWGTGISNLSNMFDGVHFENAPATAWFDIHKGRVLSVRHAYVGSQGASTPPVFNLRTGAGKSEEQGVTLVLQDIVTNPEGSGTIVDDEDRGISVTGAETNGNLGVYYGANANTAQTNPYLYFAGFSGRYTKFSGGRNGANVDLKPMTSGQLVDTLIVRDTSGTQRFGVDKNGTAIIARTSAPADADLAASELAIWLDDSAGATKVMFKAKDAGGTVRSGSVSLT